MATGFKIVTIKPVSSRGDEQESSQLDCKAAFNPNDGAPSALSYNRGLDKGRNVGLYAALQIATNQGVRQQVSQSILEGYVNHV